jgi:hypothetical protein
MHLFKIYLAKMHFSINYKSKILSSSGSHKEGNLVGKAYRKDEIKTKYY